jgi:hypothetical protein
MRDIHSEGKLRRELDPSRAATAEERVANADITGGAQPEAANAYFTVPGGTQCKSIDPGIGNEQG